MKSKLLVLVFFCLAISSVQAQSEQVETQPDRLTNLMSDREQLVMEYQFYTQQNSNF